MTKVCRLCLVKLQRGSKYFNVNAVDTYSGFMPYRDQLQMCVPEMALDLIPNPVICNVCRQNLRMAYDFKNKCMQVEEKIRNHVANQPLGDEYDLTPLATKKTPEIPSPTISKQIVCSAPEVRKNEIIIERKPIKPNLVAETVFCPETPQTSKQTFGEVIPDKKSIIMEHLISPKNQRESYRCNFCNSGFRTLQMLRQHNSQCKSKTNPPAVKTILTKRPHLPNRAKNHLKRWLFKHTEHPYPTDQEKQQLMKETDLTLLQVENWFINARRRILQDLTKLKAQCYSGTLDNPLDLDSELDLDDIYSLEKGGNGQGTSYPIEEVNITQLKQECVEKDEEMEMDKPDIIIKQELEDV